MYVFKFAGATLLWFSAINSISLCQLPGSFPLLSSLTWGKKEYTVEKNYYPKLNSIYLVTVCLSLILILNVLALQIA